MAETNQGGLGEATADGMISISGKFAALNRLILRDLNMAPQEWRTTFFRKYSREKVAKLLEDPAANEKYIRDAIIRIYEVSPHFRRLIQYFTSLSDLSYVVAPYRIDPRKANVRIMNGNYRKVLDLLSIMSIKTQFPKILRVCLREDVFYGTIIRSADCISIKQLPSDYCKIACIEGNVFNVSFNFSYFNRHPEYLDYYPQEFRIKYDWYKNKVKGYGKWIELDCPTSFAIKFNDDLPLFAVPPFIGLLRDIFDLEDYRDLKLSKTAIDNYAMLAMKIPMDDEGHWLIDEVKAKDFWSNLDSVLPPEIGSVLTPMDIQDISFERSDTSDADTVSEAEENLFSSAGVSSLLFNNTKASANALLLSIKVDQELTYGIVKSIEDMVNRYIQSFPFGKYFHVTFLDISPFNRKEASDEYLKASQYGIPMISYYCAAQGLNQAEIDNMSFLETKVLGLQDMFKPIRNSAQMSTEEIDSTSKTEVTVDVDENGPGRPVLEDDEIADQTEVNRENKGNYE